MALRVVNAMGDGVVTALRDRHPDIDVVAMGEGDPPADLTADVLFGGYGAWERALNWIERTGVRWVQLSGTGADGVPPAFFDHGRVVTCARGASAGPISEYVMAAVLAFAKRFPQVWLDEAPKYWNFPNPTMDVVEGRTLALVGLGGIGTAIARRALAFDMNVVALRRTTRPSPVDGVELASTLDEILPVADHLVLAAPATPRTQHLLDADALAKVKPGVHLVNIARGALVDQDALHIALDDGRVAMATLDTVDPEPLPADHWMYAHPNVRLSAHVSWYTPAMLGRTIELFLANLDRFLAGQPLVDVVDPVEGY
jgi:phosphoglycerate dehydrogenase-like enzyme